jgi:hypothetical protein
MHTNVTLSFPSTLHVIVNDSLLFCIPCQDKAIGYGIGRRLDLFHQGKDLFVDGVSGYPFLNGPPA